MGERHECELTVFVLSLPMQVEWLWERQKSNRVCVVPAHAGRVAMGETEI